MAITSVYFWLPTRKYFDLFPYISIAKMKIFWPIRKFARPRKHCIGARTKPSQKVQPEPKKKGKKKSFRTQNGFFWPHHLPTWLLALFPPRCPCAKLQPLDVLGPIQCSWGFHADRCFGCLPSFLSFYLCQNASLAVLLRPLRLRLAATTFRLRFSIPWKLSIPSCSSFIFSISVQNSLGNPYVFFNFWLRLIDLILNMWVQSIEV